jgi:hypothetical protein
MAATDCRRKSNAAQPKPEILEELYCSSKGLREMGECKFWKMRTTFLPESQVKETTSETNVEMK